MEQIVWILMALLLTLLIIETLKRMIENYIIDKHLKKESKELDKVIKEALEKMKLEKGFKFKVDDVLSKEDEENEEVEVL